MTSNHVVMEVIGVLESTIREARLGRISGIALVTAGGPRLNFVIAGDAKIADLYMGTAMAQTRLVQMVQEQPVPIEGSS